MSQPEFISGLELNRRFYFEAVRPILNTHFPNLPHTAAYIGTGSDVLGFDTPMSTDHDWRPAVTIFLRSQDLHYAENIHEVMSYNLPHLFYGYPTNSVQAPDESQGTYVMQETTEYPINHSVWALTLRDFFWEYLCWDIEVLLTIGDWLTIGSQELRSVTGGAVYHDAIGELTHIRKQLSWYPHDLWLYLLAAVWWRIENEEHLMGRAGYVDDELGSSIIGARLVRDLMSLCFLMEKQYAPYPKWFGSAFKQLKCAAQLTPILWQVQRAQTWQQRENALKGAYSFVARMHNTLGITQKLPETVSNFRKTRPFQVIHGDVFANAIVSQIKDEAVKRLTERPIIGSIDLFSDNSNLRSQIIWRSKLLTLYQ
ncbi:DUF4037 domain-containing protein [Fischerella sp. PCC 9605]|uniref:DUF4037 domain-containing protein n=1 Tax=Fischerella sp. PCC 9605 TaxID=1173024 RepID=UPI0004B7EA41|nr:DUF4037 domain-containing protein [Fischerella sp. PCC 9605]